MTRAFAAFLALSLLALAACEDLARFRTDDASVFRGLVVGGDGDSFIRRGFAAGTEMDLEFDAAIADRPSPGTLSTIDAASGTRVFDRTPLEPIAPLQHDQLSEYDFPGGPRLRNYIYVAHPLEGPLAGREAMVFVSLLDDGTAEVRVIAGAGDEAMGDHFGFFRLRRRER